MFGMAIKQTRLSSRSSEHIAKNLPGIHRYESGQRGDPTGPELATLNAPIHEYLAAMTGHFIGLKSAYLDPLINIARRAHFHKMARGPPSMIPAAFGGHQHRP